MLILPSASPAITRNLPAEIRTIVHADIVLRAQCGISARKVRANLRRVYAATPVASRLAGLVWYDRAESSGAVLDVRYGLPAGMGACVIAALSPRTRWEDNLAYARAILAAPNQRPAGCMPTNYTRALNVLQAGTEATARQIGTGAMVDVWGAMVASLGNGPKVYAFAHNVAGNLSHVTIDVWAVRAALTPDWKRGDESNATEVALGRKGVYEALAVVYAAEAKRAGMAPAQFQAVVWCGISGYTA